MLGLANRIGAHGPTWVHDGLVFGVGMTACAILLMAIVTSFSGCGRLAESLGRHDQLPAVFGRTSRRLMHPPAAILGVGLLAIGFIVVGALYRGQEELTLASLYSFGILIAFMMTQASVVWLRIVAPDIPRPFLMKGNVWIRGRLIPITSVVGTVLAFIAWVVALGTHPGARVVGPLWMVAGLAVYVVVRVRAGLPIIESVERDAPPPVDVTEIAYSTIVVPLERLDAIAEETMASACRLAVDSVFDERTPVVDERARPGAHPFRVTLAKPVGGSVEGVALATLVASDRPTVRWRYVLPVGVEGSTADPAVLGLLSDQAKAAASARSPRTRRPSTTPTSTRSPPGCTSPTAISARART